MCALVHQSKYFVIRPNLIILLCFFQKYRKT